MKNIDLNIIFIVINKEKQKKIIGLLGIEPRSSLHKSDILTVEI
jgi:hypothetical protein